MGVSLESVQEKFSIIVSELVREPDVLSQFAVWLDLRLAEYKLKGNISLDYSGEEPDPIWLKGLNKNKSKKPSPLSPWKPSQPQTQQQNNKPQPSPLKTSEYDLVSVQNQNKIVTHDDHVKCLATENLPMKLQTTDSGNLHKRPASTSADISSPSKLQRLSPQFADTTPKPKILYVLNLNQPFSLKSDPKGDKSSMTVPSKNTTEISPSINSATVTMSKESLTARVLSNSATVTMSKESLTARVLSNSATVTMSKESLTARVLSNSATVTMSKESLTARVLSNSATVTMSKESLTARVLSNSATMTMSKESLTARVLSNSATMTPSQDPNTPSVLPNCVKGEEVLHAYPNTTTESTGPKQKRTSLRHKENSRRRENLKDAKSFSKHMVVDVVASVACFETWLWRQGGNDLRKIEEIPPSELDDYLAKFYCKVRKANGAEFKYSEMRTLRLNIEKYLKHMKYSESIFSKSVFTKSAQSFKNCADTLQSGNKAKKAPSSTQENLKQNPDRPSKLSKQTTQNME